MYGYGKGLSCIDVSSIPDAGLTEATETWEFLSIGSAVLLPLDGLEGDIVASRPKLTKTQLPRYGSVLSNCEVRTLPPSRFHAGVPAAGRPLPLRSTASETKPRGLQYPFISFH